jgi:hypothetical protein
MRGGFTDILKSRWFATAVHAGLWVLLILAALGFSGVLPEFRESDTPPPPAQSPIPVAGLEQLSSPASWPKLNDTNFVNPFSTKHFVPPQVAPPPAPTTRKFPATYQGYYQTENGPRQTIVKISTNYVITPVGGRILSNVYVADASMQFLILTNTAAKTNVLPLNAPKEIEVPIQ